MEKEEKKDNKKKKTFSNAKILAGSLAAISASLITARLTSYVGSVLIVGISSVLLTVLAKVYEHLIRKSKKIAAKATYHLPYDKILPDAVSDHISSHLIHAMHDDDTTDIDINVETVKEKSVDEHHEPIDEEDNADDTAIIAKDEDDSQGGKIKRALLPNTPLTKAVALFCAMAVLTTGISWGVTTIFDRPDVTNVTVKEQKVQQLSPAEKDAIKKAAAEEVANQIENAQHDADTANSTNSSLSRKIVSLESTVSSLQSQITSLKTASSTASSSPPSDTATKDTSIEEINSKISAINNQITDLKNQINTLKTTVDENNDSSSSSTSGATK